MNAHASAALIALSLTVITMLVIWPIAILVTSIPSVAVQYFAILPICLALAAALIFAVKKIVDYCD